MAKMPNYNLLEHHKGLGFFQGKNMIDSTYMNYTDRLRNNVNY